MAKAIRLDGKKPTKLVFTAEVDAKTILAGDVGEMKSTFEKAEDGRSFVAGNSVIGHLRGQRGAFGGWEITGESRAVKGYTFRHPRSDANIVVASTATELALMFPETVRWEAAIKAAYLKKAGKVTGATVYTGTGEYDLLELDSNRGDGGIIKLRPESPVLEFTVEARGDTLLAGAISQIRDTVERGRNGKSFRMGDDRLGHLEGKKGAMGGWTVTGDSRIVKGVRLTHERADMNVVINAAAKQLALMFADVNNQGAAIKRAFLAKSGTITEATMECGGRSFDVLDNAPG